MGRLTHPASGATRPLAARTLVGRSRGCDVQLAGTAVSSEHAAIAWAAGGWTLRDLGSRNGTFLDGRRLSPGETAPLAVGDRIGFGEPDGAWTLDDAGSPQPIARRLTDRAERVGDGDVLALPDEDAPVVVITRSPDGWLDEARGEAVHDRDVVNVGGEPWQLWLPDEVEGTQQRPAAVSLDDVRIELAVSQDEEFVQVAVEAEGRVFTVEPRSYHYTLLTLARAWLEDDATPVAERGWVDADWLADRLRTQKRTLDVQICRIRNQFRDLGFAGAERVVERRRGTNALRLGATRVVVRPLSAG